MNPSPQTVLLFTIRERNHYVDKAVSLSQWLTNSESEELAANTSKGSPLTISVT